MALYFPQLACLTLLLTLPGLCATNQQDKSLHGRAATKTGRDEVSVMEEKLKTMDPELQGTETKRQQLKQNQNSVVKRKSDDQTWTVFQRRLNGRVNFYRNWTDYKSGFGDSSGEFWLGLEKLYQKTSKNRWELRVDLSLWNGSSAFATYSGFKVASESDGYRLHLDSFTGGDAGDSLRYHSRSRFSTPDVDNDLVNNYSCALNYHAAWWYRACYYSQLNGRYYNSSYVGNMKQAIRWPSWTNEVMKSTQMKMRQI